MQKIEVEDTSLDVSEVDLRVIRISLEYIFRVNAFAYFKDDIISNKNVLNWVQFLFQFI